MANIIAIDPGPIRSGWCIYEDGCVKDSAVDLNLAVIDLLKLRPTLGTAVAIEMIASYGMAVGKEVFNTCVWIGRFVQASSIEPLLVYRQEVKQHICHTARATDSNIRQALIDRFGGAEAIGKKKSPGPLYGVKSHMWAALAVAITVADRMAVQ